MNRMRLLAASLGLALAGTLGCDSGYDRDRFNTPTDPGAQFLQLVAQASALPADSVSQVTLTATINADSLKRDVVFTTTAGTLVGGSGTTDTERTLTVNSSGQAFIELRSALTPGMARVTARVKDLPQVAQSVDIAFTTPGEDALIQFTASPSSAPADGATSSTFVVKISPQIASSARTVQFHTTAGSFVRDGNDTDEDVPATADNTASILLFSPKEVGEGRVRATVAGVSREVRIRFDRALPGSIVLSMSKTTVKDNEEVTVTATLLREIGTVSKDTPVTFRATQDEDNDKEFGLFNSSVALTNADGVATITFTPGNSGYTGAATMTAEAPNDREESVSFQVAPPG